MDNHTLTWPTKPENFMGFGTTCVFCGRDPMEYPNCHPLKTFEVNSFKMMSQ
jgi:hypothetical protein